MKSLNEMSFFFRVHLEQRPRSLVWSRPTAPEFALLILLGQLSARSSHFRENYLKLWTVAWIAFVASRLAGDVFLAQIPRHYDSGG